MSGTPAIWSACERCIPAFEKCVNIERDSVDDAAIRTRIGEDFMRYGREWCPHTATAAEVYSRLSETERRSPWVVVATAHPAKFNEIVEPITGKPVTVPESLNRLLRLPRHAVDFAANARGSGRGAE